MIRKGGALINCSDGSEVEVIDILRLLIRRWKFILAGIVLFALCGVGIGFLLPKQYQYLSVIQIGRNSGGHQPGSTTQLFESSETVIAKLEDVYIPLARQKLSDNYPHLPNVKIEHPKGSDLVQLVTQAEPDFQKVIHQLHLQIVKQLQQDHQRLKERFVLALQADIARAKLKLQELQDPLTQALRESRSHSAISKEENFVKRLQGERQIFSQQIEMLSAKHERLQKRVHELQEALALALKNRSETAQSMGGETKAITLVMLDHQIDQDRQQLAEIENALLFDLDKEKKRLDEKIASNLRQVDEHTARIDELKNSYLKEVSDNKRQQELQKQTIDELQGKLSLNGETRILSMAVGSTALVGHSPLMVIFISSVLGAFISILLAFFAEYIRLNPLKEIQSEAP